MHAANHAITALAIKKVAPNAPLIPLLLSVQAAELLWVGFHFLGWEQTAIDTPMDSIANVHFLHMPWSHSIFAGVMLALIFGAIGAALWKQWTVAAALALGAFSHVALDLLIHAPDIAVAPFLSMPKLGLGPYGNAPILAFAIEIAFGLAVWRFVKGGWGLLVMLVVFNAVAVTFYIPHLHGGETALAGQPMQMVVFVLVQIAVTLPLTYLLAPKGMRARTAPSSTTP